MDTVRKLFAIAAVIIGLGTSPVGAERTLVLGYGAGAGGCGEWSMGTSDIAYSAWVLGYVSAVNAWASGLPADITRSMPNQSVLLWAKNWCRSHPLDKVADAADALIRELLGQTPQASRIPSPRINRRYPIS
jgi:hypothetical protein